MSRLLNASWWWLVRKVLQCRYRVRVTGLDSVRKLSGPTLIMPNHPGYIDPALVLSHVRLQRPVRPVVRTTMYRLPFLYPLMRLIHALEVPDLSEQSLSGRMRTLAMIDAVVEGLERGENFLIYPAGRTQRDGVEVIGGNRAVADILARCPQANKVLVRTRGVWGSMFTRARTGEAPEFGKRLLQGLGWLLANLFIFSPRREVVMAVELLEPGSSPALSREKLNPFLEEWYNREGPETPSFVPYHRWFGPRTLEFPRSARSSGIDLNKIRRATIDAVEEILTECLGRPLATEEKQPRITLDALGLDSLDRMDLTSRIEDRFGFHANHVPNNLGELWALADGMVAVTDGEAEAPPALWLRPVTACDEPAVLAENLAEAFVRRALRHPDDIAVADRMSGVLTYRRMLAGTWLLREQFCGLPGEAVGILLPASVGADLAFFGLLMAGKLPAVLNWTLGPSHLRQAVDKLCLRRIVTSRKLVDRLGIEAPGAELVFLEELRRGFGKVASLRTLAATYLFPRRWLRRVPRPDPDQPAVVLFTSGSESVPKAVPLSHRNLITNVRASVKALQYTRQDRLLSFLPPFHSFGLMGTLVTPLITGVRMVHYPDPTHAAGLAKTIATYQPTLLMTTPTFFSYLLRSATAQELRSLRIIGTGAEKCPDAIFSLAAELIPEATILEGYGITECSPLVAFNRVGCAKRGSVGLPGENVEICVVDPDTGQPLPFHARGMLLVRGPGVFRGYLRHEGPDPFVEMNGERWYVTGDLVQRDEEGFIYFCGRLKRFLKVGGEMVSLPALEEPLAVRWPPAEAGPQIAVEGVETPGGRCIALFTTQSISLREANAVLAQAGFRGVMRLDEVRQVESIPVLGTGKTDYKALRHMIEASLVEQNCKA